MHVVVRFRDDVFSVLEMSKLVIPTRRGTLVRALFSLTLSWDDPLTWSFSPSTFASSFGLINVSYNLAVNGTKWNTMSVAAVSLAIASTTIYLVATVSTARNIDTIRKRDARLRDPNTWHEDSSLLPEDELTRQQLLRLLLKGDADRPPSTDTNLSTFRIDIPEYRVEDEEDGYLARPRSTYAGRSRSGSRTSMDHHLSPSDHRVSPTTPHIVVSGNPGNAPPSPGRGRPQSRDMRRQEIETRLDDVNLVPRINRVQTETWGPI
jgi:hypothetical protein